MTHQQTNNYGHDPTPNQNPKKPSVLVDYERYAAMLDHPDLSEAQKKEFIDCLWNLISELIYLGVEVLPQEDEGNVSNEDRFENMLGHIESHMVDSESEQSNKLTRKNSAS